MEIFSITVFQMLTLVLIMSVGFFMQKRGIIDDKGAELLSKILTVVVIPVYTVNAFQSEFSPEIAFNAAEFALVIILSYIIAAAIGVISYKAFRISRDKKFVWIFNSTFTNNAYIGVPVVTAIYGDNISFLLSVAIILFNLLAIILVEVMMGSSRKKMESL